MNALCLWFKIWFENECSFGGDGERQVKEIDGKIASERPGWNWEENEGTREECKVRGRDYLEAERIS